MSVNVLPGRTRLLARLRARPRAPACLLAALAASLAGCGGGGSSTPSVGRISITGFAPLPVPGGEPVPFTIFGTNFETEAGTTATVRFHALDGSMPFSAGTVDRTDVDAIVMSDGTVQGLTPRVTICDAAGFPFEVTVTLESGISATSGGGPGLPFFFTGPTVEGIAPSVVPALVPTPLTITGTGFGPTGGTAIVRFTADLGATCFGGGSSSTVEVVGTVTSSTTITATSPASRNPIVGSGLLAASVDRQGAGVHVRLPSGSCAGSGPGLVEFDRPDGTFSPARLPQTIATPFGVVQAGGTDVFPSGGTVTVRFVAVAAGTPFGAGTSEYAEVSAAPASGGVLAGTSPLAVAPVDFRAEVRLLFEDGTVGLGAPEAPLFVAPPFLTDVLNDEAPVNALRDVAAPARTFLTRCSSPMRILGSNFDPAAVVAIYDEAVGVTKPIGLGTLEATITTISIGPGTILGDSPRDLAQVGTLQAGVRVTNPDGQFAQFTAGNFLFATRGDFLDRNATSRAGGNGSVRAAVDPTGALRVAVVSAQGDGAAGTTDTLVVSRSTDGGRTWTTRTVDGSVDGLAAVERFHPRTAYDRFGNLYVAYLARTGAGDHLPVLLQSSDGGASFGRIVTGAPVDLAFDGTFLAVGPDGGGAGEAVHVGWHVQDTQESIEVAGVVSAGLGSLDAAFGPVATVVTAPPLTHVRQPYGAVDAQGDLFVLYTAGLPSGPSSVQMHRDPLGLSGGAAFGPAVVVVTTNVNLLGEASPAAPGRGVFPDPEVVALRSGPFAGRLVFTWTDETPEDTAQFDASTRSSDDEGTSFSPVRTLADFAGGAQYQATAAFDPVTGALHAAWCDGRADPQGGAVERYGSTSHDGGVTWEPNLRLSDAPSDPAGLAEGDDFGAWMGIAAHDGCVIAAWADASNSTGDDPDGTATTDVYVTRSQNGP